MTKTQLLIFIGILLMGILAFTSVNGEDSIEEILHETTTDIQIQNEYLIKDGNNVLTNLYTFYLPAEKMTCYSTYHSWSISCIRGDPK